MERSEYLAHDAVGLAALIAKGQVSPEQVRAAAISAIEATNSHINAVIEIWDDEPIPPIGEDSGPFAGVPFLVKDLALTVKGRQYQVGSRLGAGFVAQSDTELMRRFRAAGLVTVGRTTTPELGISTTCESFLTGPTRNPWDTNRSPGGSSGGSGAAVAAGVVPMAHATDGGGSIRVPAACNGLFGLKPTRGRVSNGPEVDEVWSGLAVQFALTRTVRDSATLLDAVQGGGIGEPYYIAPPICPYAEEIALKPVPLRIGFVRHPLSGKTSDPVMTAAIDDVAHICTSLGHHVEQIKLDIGVSWEAFVLANVQFWTTNTAAWMDVVAASAGRTAQRELVEPATWAVAEYGRKASAVDFLEALDVRNTVTRHMGAFYQKWDLLLTPQLAELPLTIGVYNKDQEKMDGFAWVNHVFERSPFTALANVAGLPAMAIPLSFDPVSQMPISSQFVANFGREDHLYRLAAQLEQAAPWRDRKPKVWAGSAAV